MKKGLNKDEEARKFSVKNEAIYYNGKKMLTNNIYPFEKYRFQKEYLSYGGSGIVYIAKHTFLQKNQIIKFYYPTDEISLDKNKLEIQKNSDSNLREIVANYHDAGIVDYPQNILYSIMDYMNDYLTFDDWITKRDAVFEELDENPDISKIDQGLGVIFSKTLNVAIGFLKTYLFMISKSITHGDLNKGNILVGDNFPEPPSDNRALLNRLIRENYNEIGYLEAVDVKFIDLGTSQIEETDRTYGNQRDGWLVFDTLRRLFKILLPKNKSLKQYLKYDIDNNNQKIMYSEIKELVKPDELASNLSRMIFFMNIIFGHIFNSGNSSVLLTINDEREINTIISNYPISAQDRTIDKNIMNSDTLSVINTLSKTTNENSVLWDNFFLDIKRNYPKLLNGYSIKFNRIQGEFDKRGSSI